MENSSDSILAYFRKEIKQEYFQDPFESIPLKLITVVIYMIEVLSSLVPSMSLYSDFIRNLYKFYPDFILILS